MTQMMDCSEARVSLGVYVLGAIDPAERSMVDSHLATCRDCRDELAGLAGLPALLSRVSMEEAVALAEGGTPPFIAEDELPPTPELVGTVTELAAVRRRRRRWQETALGVAAALVIAAGLFGGLRMTAAPQVIVHEKIVHPSLPPWEREVPGGNWQNATGQSGGMGLAVKYRQVGWGTELTAKVTGIPRGTTCEMWVIGPGKTRLLAGSWTVNGDESGVWYQETAAIPASNVEKFVVTIGKNRSITANS